MTCPLCRQRRGKRTCPAKGELICSACCGGKRRVEIDCPSDCTFLTGAHAGGWAGRARERERDLRRLSPHLEGLTEAQRRIALLALVGTSAIREGRRDLDDRLLLEAIVALRKTAETREKGILYDHPVQDARAQGLAHELGLLFEGKDAEGASHAPADRDLAAALRGLEAALVAVAREGESPHAFLDTATRLAGRLGAPSPVRGRPLIVEP
jgi:hypothetical protein